MQISSKNKILISMPNIIDPYFSNSVILLCEHNKKGAMGIIINKKIDASILNEIIDLKYYSHIFAKSSFKDVFFGGPMFVNTGFVLHRSIDKTKNTVRISKDFSITDYKNAQTLINKKNKIDHKLVFGHASWSSGQLESEIGRGDWLIQNISSDFVFSENSDKMWDNATSSLGFDSGSIAVMNAKA